MPEFADQRAHDVAWMTADERNRLDHNERTVIDGHVCHIRRDGGRTWLAGPMDVSPAHLMTMQGYDPKCWLGYSHSEEEHAAKLA